jgi:hypothetical protein
MDETPENWALLEPIRKTLGKVIERGKDPTPILDAFFHGAGTESSTLQPKGPPLGPTVKSYTTDVFLPYNLPPRVRKAQARDYRRHLKIVIETLGDLPLATLEPSDIRGLQAELIDRGLSTKYVKNILSGSFRAMIQQALDDRVLAQDPFPRKLKWPRWQVPPADPFTDEEREGIEDWFREKRFGVRPGPGTTKTHLVAYPPRIRLSSTSSSGPGFDRPKQPDSNGRTSTWIAVDSTSSVRVISTRTGRRRRRVPIGGSNSFRRRFKSSGQFSHSGLKPGNTSSRRRRGSRSSRKLSPHAIGIDACGRSGFACAGSTARRTPTSQQRSSSVRRSPG